MIGQVTIAKSGVGIFRTNAQHATLCLGVQRIILLILLTLTLFEHSAENFCGNLDVGVA